MTDRPCAAPRAGARRATGVLLGSCLALALAGCATRKPPPLETITVPIPANQEAVPPTPAAPPLPRLPITQSEGEDLWHLRSGLNVAALICDPRAFTALVPGYNQMLRTHKALLSTAVEKELSQFRANGKDWQARYDTHMTRVYNLYSLTRQRPEFCTAATAVVGEAGGLDSPTLADKATVLLERINLAANVK